MGGRTGNSDRVRRFANHISSSKVKPERRAVIASLLSLNPTGFAQRVFWRINFPSRVEENVFLNPTCSVTTIPTMPKDLKPATDAGFRLLDIKANALDIRAILVNDNLNSEGRRDDKRTLTKLAVRSIRYMGIGRPLAVLTAAMPFRFSHSRAAANPEAQPEIPHSREPLKAPNAPGSFHPPR